MRLTYALDTSLPRLAWCARVAKGGVVTIVHGEWVETHAHFMTDGAWEGEFEAGNAVAAQLLMGFAVAADGERVVFCTPAHTLERLHLIERNERLFVSPSMAFALAMSGDRLDCGHIPYHADLEYCVRKPENHVARLPLARARHVTLVHYRNMEVDSSLRVRFLSKPEPPTFRSFAEYRGYLADGLKGIVRNASALGRRVRYEPLTTLSKGYDSTACAALATEAGCREAVTFRTGRKEGSAASEPDDSGSTIGRSLGLNVEEFDRDAYRRAEDFPEAEFVVCGDLGQELPWSAFGTAFERRLVVSGTHGDVVWERHAKPARTGIFRKGMDGCSLVEFRSRVGCVIVVPAFFGAWSHPSIHAISNSQEMRAWTVPGRYDRPIPRRIAEESGVPREAFGQNKCAVTVLLSRDGALDRFMNPHSRTDFERFWEEHLAARARHRQLLYSALFAVRVWFDKWAEALHLSRLLPCPVPWRYRKSPGRPSFLVHWAMPLIQQRYARAARAESTRVS